MKKSFVALAVAGLVAASSAATAATVYDKDGTSVAVYGRVQSVFYSDDASGVNVDGKVNDGDASINSSARFGLNLRSQLNANVAAFALAEWEAANGNNGNDTDDSFDARYLWVGLDFGQFGSVKVGKFEEAIKYAITQTDIFDDWGCTGMAGNDDRREGVIMYEWSGNGFDAKISYAFSKENEHLDGAYFNGATVKLDGSVSNRNGETADIKNSFSVAAGYTSPNVVFGPIAVKAGYITGSLGDKKVNNTISFEVKNPVSGLISNVDTFHVDSYDQYALGLSWGSLSSGPYVGVVYQQRSFDVKSLITGVPNADYDVTGLEFAAGYSFPNGVTVRTGYLTQEVDILGEKVDAATVPVYVNYQLNPQFNVWAEARFDAGTDDDKNGGKNFAETVGGNYAENVFSAGLRYSF